MENFEYTALTAFLEYIVLKSCSKVQTLLLCAIHLFENFFLISYLIFAKGKEYGC